MTQEQTKTKKRPSVYTPRRKTIALNNIYFFGVNPLKVDGETILHIDLDKPFKGAKHDPKTGKLRKSIKKTDSPII